MLWAPEPKHLLSQPLFQPTQLHAKPVICGHGYGQCQLCPRASNAFPDERLGKGTEKSLQAQGIDIALGERHEPFVARAAVPLGTRIAEQIDSKIDR